jgi:hypothetical protein
LSLLNSASVVKVCAGELIAAAAQNISAMQIIHEKLNPSTQPFFRILADARLNTL